VTTAATDENPTAESSWVPLWREIERIASAIGDSQEPGAFPKARLWIRQAALEGRLRIRGRHEIKSNSSQAGSSFSDVYTDIPPLYWKNSVINYVAMAASFDVYGHTMPESPDAWGPEGLDAINRYASLQLNVDDVLQLIGCASEDQPGATPVPEEEEWISAADALALLGIGRSLGISTICKRAHAGLIKARADRFIHNGGRMRDNYDIPVQFWWAGGGPALHQNWTTGDFETWVKGGIHLQAFGVKFRRADIERARPTPAVPNVVSTKADAPNELRRDYAFIVMPIDKDDHQLVDVLDTIKAAASTCGVTAERVDEVESNDRITDRILDSIRKAEFVIVDLTKDRPNVFFEAGFAHGLGKTPIYVARAGTSPQFDIKDFPIIFFQNMKELREGITRRLTGLRKST
jgi:hypothetical protein